MIREARLEDLDQLLELLYQLSPSTDEDLRVGRIYLENIFGEMIAERNQTIYVYESGEKLLGTATLVVQLNLTHGGKPYAHLENVVTDKSCRGNGIGKKLIDYLVEEANKRGCYKKVLSCEGKNVPFYERCRFRRTGEIEMRL